MKWVISNTVALNGGDAAILHGVAACIARVDPEAEIRVFDSHPSAAEQHHPRFRFAELAFTASRRARWPRWARLLGRLAARGWIAPPASLRTAIEAYREADVVVATGGTYLVPIYGLEPRLFDFELARAAGTPLVLFTQSLGPFEGHPQRERVARNLAAARLVLLRDERSRAHLESIGVPRGHLSVRADVVFALAEPAVLEAGAQRSLPSAPRVGISVRGWRHFAEVSAEDGMENYLGSVAAMVEHLVRSRGAEVCFLSTCQGIESYPHQDAQVAQRVFERLPEAVQARTTVDVGFHDPFEVREAYANFDLVIATRMHAAILALCAGTPVLPIAYEFKTRALFENLGLAEHLLDIETLIPTASVEALDRLIEQLPRLRGPLMERVAALREDALLAAEDLRAALTG